MKKTLSILLCVLMFFTSLSFTAFARDEIIITTEDSLCKLQGSWTESTNNAVKGPNDNTSWYTDKLNSQAIYDASNLEKGTYGVYLYMTPYGTTAPKVLVTVTASGKTANIVTDGTHGGAGNRHWIYLGTYTFDGTDGDSVSQKIYDKQGGFMRASGVKFVKNDTNKSPIDKLEEYDYELDFSEQEIVITTDDKNLCKLNGEWAESTNSAVMGPTGGTSWYTTKTDATAVYDASKLKKGNYGVYLYMTPYASTAPKVSVSITASGKETVLITSGTHGGQGNRHWLFLGKYDFDGSQGDSVSQRIYGDSKAGHMRTSGIKFIKNDSNTADIDRIEPDLDASAYSAPEIIITPNDSLCNLQGKWKESTNIVVAGPKNSTSWYTTDRNAAAICDASVLNGNYGVYLFVTPYGTTADLIDVTITASGKSETILTHGGHGGIGNRHWIFLGKYDFNGTKGDSVVQKINSDSFDGNMRTSGVKFVKDDTNTSEIDFYEPPFVSALTGTDIHIVERMGMLIGEGNGITEEYLKKVPTRVQAAIMVLRLNGVDAEAAAFTGKDNFADASLEPWASAYLAYLKANPQFGLIGIGDNMFDPTANISAQAYAKILLTALGYEYNVDFTWDNTIAFAGEKGITIPDNAKFTVKDLAVMTESVLSLDCKDGTKYLTYLIAKRDGVKDDGVYGTELTPELKALREDAKNKKTGIIYNNDGNDIYKAYPEYPGAYDISHLDGNTINAENFLKARSYGLEDTQVNTVFYCTGVFNSYHHESSGITDTRVRDWARALKDYTGKDSLTTMVDYVHSIDRDIFWSMRMNDAHDASYQENQLDPWKQANMDLLMFKKSESGMYMRHGNNRWSCVDYTLTPVRQVVYDILKDTLTRYDIDGLELDFTRHPLFFKEVTMGYDIYPENLERMNNLIRMIRDMTEKISIERGKPILLAIYTYDSIALNKAIGLDIETWLKEDLIDIVSIGGAARLQTWEDAIAEYKDYNAKIFAGIDTLLYKDDGADEYELNKNQAALAYAAGADGIYLYNYFNVNHQMFDTLGSPETCGPVTIDVVPHLTRYGGNLAKDTTKFVTINK